MSKVVELLKELVTKETPKTLYIHRKVLNPHDLITWAKSEGFKTCLTPDDLHCTVMYSKTPVLWSTIPKAAKQIEVYGEGRSMAAFSDATVLKIKSVALQDRWRQLKALGCSYDYPTYQPHITLSYKLNKDIDIGKINVYDGEIFLGPEHFRVIENNWSAKIIEES